MLLYRDPEDVETAIRYVIAMCRWFPEQSEKIKTDKELKRDYLWNVHHVNFVFKQLPLYKLTDYELNILYMRYELDYKFSKIAKILGYSEVHARRILQHIFEKLAGY